MRELLCVAMMGLCLAQAAFPQTASKFIELSKTDLFTTKRWDSKQISVMGLHLGMTRQDAIAEARRRRLHLINNSPQYLYRGDCTGDRHCLVVEADNAGSGISLELDSKDQIMEIIVQPWYPNPGPKDGILGSFQGDTYRLFHRYSDELRVKLLGPPDEYAPPEEGTAVYRYLKLGLVLYVHPLPAAPGRIDVSAELFSPHP